MILYYILVTFSSQVSHTGKNAFSLDGAKTKFPSLEHLVDFHKMNSGPLPTILQESALGLRLVEERRGEDCPHDLPVSGRTRDIAARNWSVVPAPLDIRILQQRTLSAADTESS